MLTTTSDEIGFYDRRGKPCSCSRPGAVVTLKVYDPYEGRAGLIRCTPDAPEGCCSFDEGDLTIADAQAECDRWNARVASTTIEPFCACGRVVSECDGSRRGCRR